MKHLRPYQTPGQYLGELFASPVSKPNDSTTGQRLKEKGIKEVSEHNENWMEECLKVAKWFVFQHGLTGEFTGEDIRLYCVTNGGLDQPKHPNAWGALINTLIKRKIIVPTGEYRKSKHAEAHARKNAVYKAV